MEHTYSPQIRCVLVTADSPMHVPQTNCRSDFVEHVSWYDAEEIKCAQIIDTCDTKPKTYNLKMGHTSEDYEAFLEEIDFDYDRETARTAFTGMIWWNGEPGTFSEMCDGEWSLHGSPDIPKELLR